MITFDRVKKLCDEQGLSIVELEEKVGFGRNSLYKWKKQSPKTETLQKVADYFNVSVDFLLGRTDQKHIDEPETIAAHHDNYDFTEEELEEIEEFKRFVAMRRETRKSKGD